MQTIYQVTIHGRILESRDLRKLLSRAVSEKRMMDRRIRMFPNVRQAAPPLYEEARAAQA